MSIVLPTPDAALAARFAGGDENALATLYRQQYDSLLSAARHVLGDDLAHYRGRVAHKAMPVSYTHLDVYKRQPPVWATRATRRPPPAPDW